MYKLHYIDVIFFTIPTISFSIDGTPENPTIKSVSYKQKRSVFILSVYTTACMSAKFYGDCDEQFSWICFRKNFVL